MLVAALAALTCVSPCGAGVWYVRADAPPSGNGLSFASAFQTLDAALASAVAGDEVRVAAGTYVPSTPGGRGATFTLKPGVAIYGGFAGDNDAFESRSPLSFPTVLSGDRAGDDEPGWVNRADNCYRVITSTDPAVAASTVVDGFVITGGNADGPVLTGGGMYVLDGAPSVRGCVFIENSAGGPSDAGAGGAVRLESSGPSRAARFDGCRFESNLATGGGAVALSGGGLTATFVRCTFLANVAGEGGAISVSQAGAVIADGRFLTNSAVTGDGGAILSVGGRPTLMNCELAWNTARYGGAMLVSCCNQADVSNCTLVGNYATMRAGGVRVASGGSITLVNSILSDNSDGNGLDQGAQVHGADGTSLITIDRCLVTGWTGSLGGAGNFSADPAFADAHGPDEAPGTLDDDYRLLASSPCIDAGDAVLLPPDIADLDGDGQTSEWLPLDLRGAGRTLDGDLNGFEQTDLGASEYHCPADFDQNGFVNGDDFDSFTALFDAGDPLADFDQNGFVNGDDFDSFTAHFDAGC